MKEVLAVFVTFLSVSCSFQYQDWGVKNPDQIPQTVMTDFTERSVKNGKVQFEFRGDRAETYEVLKEWRLKGVSFEEYDDTGAVSNRGTVSEATIKTDTHDASMKGAVQIWSASQKAEISTSDLEWLQKTKTLKTDPEASVTLKKDDGSTLTGKGLSLNFRENQMTLQGPVIGVWMTEATDENKSTKSPQPFADANASAAAPSPADSHAVGR